MAVSRAGTASAVPVTRKLELWVVVLVLVHRIGQLERELALAELALERTLLEADAPHKELES